MMNEEIRKERMEKHGCITYCEKEDAMCFGILTENGECKYETCLHDDPEWIRQQERIREKKKAIIEPPVIAKPEKEAIQKPIEPKFTDFDRERAKIRNLEAKARSLYQAGERKEADRAFNKAKKARQALWDIQNG